MLLALGSRLAHK